MEGTAEAAGEGLQRPQRVLAGMFSPVTDSALSKSDQAGGNVVGAEVVTGTQDEWNKVAYNVLA